MVNWNKMKNWKHNTTCNKSYCLLKKENWKNGARNHVFTKEFGQSQRIYELSKGVLLIVIDVTTGSNFFLKSSSAWEA